MEPEELKEQGAAGQVSEVGEALARAVVDYLRRRRRLVARLARIDATIAAWGTWQREVDWSCLGRIPSPAGAPPAGLTELRRLLVEELGRLDGAI